MAVEGELVLIGFAEAYAAIETAWSLRDAGYRVAAFARTANRPALRRVRNVDMYEVAPPEADAARTVEDLARLIARLRPAAFMPLDDATVWLASKLPEDVTVVGPTGDRAELALNKQLQLDAARAAGLPVPPTRVVEDPQELTDLDVPVVVKPARALYEVDGRLARPTGSVCANDEELRRVAADAWYTPLLVQPLLHGVGEGVFGLVGAHGPTAWSSHRRMRMVNPQGSASSACRSQAVDESLREPAARFLLDAGWTGLFMLEFLRDTSGDAWLMELNGRPWGSLALARRRGLEYPAWAVAAALEPSFQPPVPEALPEIVCRHLGMELVHLAFVARGPQSEALTEWPRLATTVRDMLRIGRRDRLYNWRRSEPDVLAADTLDFIRFYMHRARGAR